MCANRRFLGVRVHKIVIGGIRAEFSHTLREFGSEQFLEIILISRDACSNRCSPMLTAIPGVHESGSEVGLLAVRKHRFDDRLGLKSILRASCGILARLSAPRGLAYQAVTF